MDLLTYESFLTNSKIVESRRQLLVNIFNQFEDIKPIMNEAIAIVEFGSLDEVFEGEINEEICFSNGPSIGRIPGASRRCCVR